LDDSLKLKLERRIIMKKIYGVLTLVAMLMGATLLLQRTVKVAAAAAPTGIKNVVLVHGAFADGSGWEAVAKILEKDGYTVSVAQPPETSYAEDQKYTKAAIDAMGGASGSGGPQLWGVHHHRGRQSSKRCGACLYCRIRAR
jgi:hypothetical protein